MLQISYQSLQPKKLKGKNSVTSTTTGREGRGEKKEGGAHAGTHRERLTDRQRRRVQLKSRCPWTHSECPWLSPSHLTKCSTQDQQMDKHRRTSNAMAINTAWAPSVTIADWLTHAGTLLANSPCNTARVPQRPGLGGWVRNRVMVSSYTSIIAYIRTQLLPKGSPRVKWADTSFWIWRGAVEYAHVSVRRREEKRLIIFSVPFALFQTYTDYS